MAEEMSPIDERLWTVLDLPMKSLAALGQAPLLTAGGLSPLTRLSAPPAPHDAAGMAELLADIEEMSPWAPAALLDPSDSRHHRGQRGHPIAAPVRMAGR